MEQVRGEYRDRIEVVLCDSPEAAIEGSNLILMASGAVTPLITADMVTPGTTIIGIEGFRDMDPQIAKLADKWYLGYKEPDKSILKWSEAQSGAFAGKPGCIRRYDGAFEREDTGKRNRKRNYCIHPYGNGSS